MSNWQSLDLDDDDSGDPEGRIWLDKQSTTVFVKISFHDLKWDVHHASFTESELMSTVLMLTFWIMSPDNSQYLKFYKYNNSKF